MKKLSLLCLLLGSFSLAAFDLMPLGSSTCLNGLAEQCPAGTTLLYGEQGCGCLSSDQYFDSEMCAVINFRCAEGLSYSSLTRYQSESQIGCGCFKTSILFFPTEG